MRQLLWCLFGSLLLATPFAMAYTDFETAEWEGLPIVQSLQFANGKLGIVTQVGDHYILKKDHTVVLESDREFCNAFPTACKKAQKLRRYRGTFTAHDKSTIEAKYEECADEDEGEFFCRKAYLIVKGKKIRALIDEGLEISAADFEGDKLFIGTTLYGENGYGPGHGLFVQSMKEEESSPVLRFDKQDDLSGDWVHAITVDPATKDVWVATELGLDRLKNGEKPEEHLYYYWDFNEKAADVGLFVSTERRPSHPLVKIIDDLNVQVTPKLLAEIKHIPQSALDRLAQTQPWLHEDPTQATVDYAFVPKEMNNLFPYVLEAEKKFKGPRFLSWSVCLFNDPATMKYYKGLLEKNVVNKIEPWRRTHAKNCVEKFTRLGLVAFTSGEERHSGLLRDLKAGLEASHDPGAGRAEGPDQVVQSLKGLYAMGDKTGMLQVERFYKSNKDDFDNGLFYALLQNFPYTPEIVDIAYMGLERKTSPSDLDIACRMFDMNFESLYGKRYSTKYAVELLKASKKLSDGEAEHALDSCEKSFASQMTDKPLAAEFKNKIYPKLPDDLKKLADEITGGKSAPKPKPTETPVKKNLSL